MCPQSETLVEKWSTVTIQKPNAWIPETSKIQTSMGWEFKLWPWLQFQTKKERNVQKLNKKLKFPVFMARILNHSLSKQDAMIRNPNVFGNRTRTVIRFIEAQIFDESFFVSSIVLCRLLHIYLWQDQTFRRYFHPGDYIYLKTGLVVPFALKKQIFNYI
jgi:hypothetical protein